MRTPRPLSHLFFGCARFPFTPRSPFWVIRWMCENDSPGNRASRKRATRMPVSSAGGGGGLTTAAAARRRPCSSPCSLLAKLRPKLQPFAELALEPARGRIIELLPAQLLREIVLTGECIRRIVIVPIILAITFRAHQPGRRVENVLGG